MRKTCLETIYKVAKDNDNVVFIGSDLGPGVLENMKNEMPKRFFMEGISEQHIIGMAAGMAKTELSGTETHLKNLEQIFK